MRPALIAIVSLVLGGFVSVGVGGAASAPSFAPAVNYATGTNANSAVIRDLNGDGKPDLAVSGTDLSDYLHNPGAASVFLGNGDGTFQAAVNYPTGPPPPAPNTETDGEEPVEIASGDLNLDGKPDLVTVNFGQGTISELLGNGDGTFQTAIILPQSEGQLDSVAVADLNRDGKPDLAFADFEDNKIGVLLGNGDGTFQPAVHYPTATGPSQVVVADLNRDGKPDLAAVNDVDVNVSVLLGNGDGTFQAAVNYPIHTPINPHFGPESLAVGDVNGDGKPDIATADVQFQDVAVMLGNGDGTFQSPAYYLADQTPFHVVMGDVNGDGKLDLAVANKDSNDVSVLIGNGDGTFQAPVNFAAGNSPLGLAIGDLNGGGKPDLAVPNSQQASVLLNTTNFPPVCAGVTASPSSFLPATRDQMKLVTLSGASDPERDTLSFHIDAVSQDEPVSGSGVGDDTSPDAALTAAGANSNQVFVRAERNPMSNGRVYRIAYTASDGHGGSCSGTAGVGGNTTAKVSVPRKKGQTAVDDGNTASWNSFTGARVFGTLP
jgi:FG-GAP-like repeat